MMRRKRSDLEAENLALIHELEVIREQIEGLLDGEGPGEEEDIAEEGESEA